MAKKKTSEKERYSKWYAKVKDDRNKRRRDDYNPTPEEIEANRKKARENAKTRVPKEEHLHMYIDGELVNVFRVGHVACKLGRPLHTVKYWESKGYIPEHTLDSRQRMYTQHQVDLIIHLGSYMPFRKKRGVALAPEVIEQIKYVAANWNPTGE